MDCLNTTGDCYACQTTIGKRKNPAESIHYFDSIALPYILTIVLTIFRSNFRVPAKLGVPYRKEG